MSKSVLVMIYFSFFVQYYCYWTVAPVFAGSIYSVSLTNGLGFPLNYSLIFIINYLYHHPGSDGGLPAPDHQQAESSEQ